MFAARQPSDIDRFFRGLTEYAFHSRLGVVDPPLVDYVALLLVRSLRLDTPAGTAPVAPDAATVTRMLDEARGHAAAEARAEFRQIGDATLFWSGLYPEALRRLRHSGPHDDLGAYREAGRRAYWLVSTLEPDDAAEERLLFERLAHDYDLCVEGLGEVRRAWSEAA
jgi:hypothetical protein